MNQPRASKLTLPSDRNVTCVFCNKAFFYVKLVASGEFERWSMETMAGGGRPLKPTLAVAPVSIINLFMINRTHTLHV